jgi:hypothetical protein
VRRADSLHPALTLIASDQNLRLYRVE